MGRRYLFECSRCPYRARVSGGEDRGRRCFVETFECLSCHDLFDAVTHLRLTGQARARPMGNLRQPVVAGLTRGALPDHVHCSWTPARVAAAMRNRLLPGAPQAAWIELKVRCPQSARHPCRIWKHPGRCPRCGSHLERTLWPFLEWE